jgi:hypothetical protein
MFTYLRIWGEGLADRHAMATSAAQFAAGRASEKCRQPERRGVLALDRDWLDKREWCSKPWTGTMILASGAGVIDEAAGAEQHAAVCRWLLRAKLMSVAVVVLASSSTEWGGHE